MKCPFRTNIKYEYTELVKDTFVISEQNEDFADCLTYDCPFYEYGGKCTRLDNDD